MRDHAGVTGRPPPEAPASLPPIGWVLYDGACGLCARWVPRWTPTFTRLGLATAALQEPWVAARTGLAEAELVRDFRILFHDGTVLGGADAYRWILRRRWWGFPLWLFVVVPPGRWVFDFGYRRLNRNRHQVSRWCGIRP